MTGTAVKALDSIALEAARKARDAAWPLDSLEPAIRAYLSALTASASEPAPSFQARVQPWMTACFGEEISNDRVERGDRFLEEVFELLQSGGYDPARVLSLRDYVWSRDKGEPSQEVGGVMVTLAAYCLAHELDMHEAGETELARIWTKVEKIRAKQAAKPKHSPLPVPASEPEPVADAAPVAFMVHNAMVARGLSNAPRSGIDDKTVWFYPAEREQHARDAARTLHADCVPLYANPVPTQDGAVEAKPDGLRETILAVLRDYRMYNFSEADDASSGYPLVDMCTPKGQGIDKGEEELFLIADEIAAALSHPADGWRLVPVVPTEEMIRAGAKGYQNSARSSFIDGWNLALAAAPAVKPEGE
ncbi:hypothetical protein [Mesorhizobium sp. Pch-S]|uniref:hypothetical protein n=1 Tax=Mesorhizobium sp. Pch-S TaxID=2082387 RepID=UPI001FE1E20E|nr:hypothetical protein [Mesorhizobium sp. Pch-S]